VAKCLEIGITGTIQRFNLRNVRIVADISSADNWAEFTLFLRQCRDQEMIDGFQIEKEEVATFQYEDFLIIQDFSSRVVKGEHSDGDYAKRSESSSNKEVRTF
jgi:hypothetical protein